MSDEYSVGIRIKELRNSKGISQEEMATSLGLAKSTISQWELGKAYPKRKNLIQLAKYFNVTLNSIESGFDSNLDREREDGHLVKTIPFYDDVCAAAGEGVSNYNEAYRLIHTKDLPDINASNLFCIKASGDSMEPAIKDGSLLVVDGSQTNVVDGKMYVFRQDGFLRVKLFCYEKNQIRITSYNKEYKDELYRFDELEELRIIGKVVWYSTILS